jgi:hypothetical protein
MSRKECNAYMLTTTSKTVWIVVAAIVVIGEAFSTKITSTYQIENRRLSIQFMKGKDSVSSDNLTTDREYLPKQDEETITILGFGSLLSERSSRLTFPDLMNFRLGYVPNYRRVFGHPTSIFFRRNIANYETKQMSSLAVEPANEMGLVVSVFEVSNANMMTNGIPSIEFLEREEEFDIVSVPYYELIPPNNTTRSTTTKMGIICAKSTDEKYLERWGKERFEENYGRYGINSIWTWSVDSGLLPCSVYLRHCYLAAKGQNEICFNSFLDETFLVDRETTIRQYLDKHPEVLEVTPPPDLVDRYSG